MTSRDDATRAVVAPLLADLRSDLLVMPREALVEQHVEMMAFEQQLLATPRFVQKKTARPVMRRPRRMALAFVCICTTLVSCGLSAAGALPAPLQHITNSIAHTLGVPQPTPTPGAPSGAAHTRHGAKPVAAAPAKPTATSKVARPSTPAVTGTHTPHTSTPPATTAPVVAVAPKLPGPKTKISTTRPRKTKRRITPVKPGSPPSNDSQNTPPGYPTKWRARAAAAATAQLTACAQAVTLTETGCPQEATPAGGAQAASAHWTLLNQPQTGAVVVAQTVSTGSGKHITHTTTVTVYELFQMEATYTEVGGTGTYLAYSGGIGAATMTWNGSSFVHASFAAGSAAGHLLPGVKVPAMQPPAGIDDTAVLGAVLAAFNACTASAPPTTGPVASCPQAAVTGAQWSLVGDPTQGAVVAFDPTQGVFTVTGTYAMTPDGGATQTGGAYTATVFYDGSQLQVPSIIGA